MVSVHVQAALEYTDQCGKLFVLSRARIPLALANSVELTVFRERHGIGLASKLLAYQLQDKSLALFDLNDTRCDLAMEALNQLSLSR